MEREKRERKREREEIKGPEIKASEETEARYRVVRKLAEGGSGAAYLVWDKRLDKNWVMKCIPLQREGQKEAVLREMEALKHIHREGIPVLVDAFCEKGQICLIMEYMTGVSLEEKIRLEGPMEERAAVSWALQTAKLVDFLHKLPGRMVHGDLKPLNLIYHNGKAALLDFGGAVSLNKAGTAPCCYTPGYGAPELLKGGKVSERTDIYAFGAVLFYLVTGENPASCRGIYPVREQNPTLSKKVEGLILKCTAQNGADRFGSMEEIIETLQGMASSLEVRGVKSGKTGKDNNTGRGRKKRVFRCIRNVLLTEGKMEGRAGGICRAALLLAAGIWYAGTGAMAADNAQAAMQETGAVQAAAVMQETGSARAAENHTAAEVLPVSIRNRAGERLLVEFGAVYHTEENLMFELPVKYFEEGREYEVTIRQKERESGTVRERTFVICAD